MHEEVKQEPKEPVIVPKTGKIAGEEIKGEDIPIPIIKHSLIPLHPDYNDIPFEIKVEKYSFFENRVLGKGS